MKRSNSAENKAAIKELNNEIRNLLFIEELVSVNTPNKKSYPKLAKEGFYLNDRHYVRFMCGAGHARTNRSLFIAEDIFEKVDEILRCGIGRNVTIAPAKWNAYYALTSSATYRVSEPKVVVVPDKEIKMTKTVDWIEHDDAADTDEIIRQDRELNFNLWDGMGLICPRFANQWAQDVELDYLPSAFVVRNAFCKGLVAVFDFHRFAAEVAQKDEITDLWGKVHNIFDVDIILTQSQFKLWSAYKSWEEYVENTHKSDLHWGVSKFSPNPVLEKNTVFTNYQFLQVLDFSEKDMHEFCDYTSQWFKDVCGDDVRALILYLVGKIANSMSESEVWEKVSDPYVKAILIDNTLGYDNFIRDRISKSIEKKMKLAKMGKLLTHGNFQFMIADPYGLAQHAFGMEVTGLLKEFQHYSQYWNKYGSEKIIAERAPLTWRSEVNILNLQENDVLNDWYQYLTSGIVYNVWGVDCMLAADSDFDGDIVYTTNNINMINSVSEKYRGVPITYKPSKVEKKTLDYSELAKFDEFAYNTKIGYITNCSTTLYEMQYLYEPGSEEYNEIQKRLKLCRKAQGMEIDKAKIGKQIPSIPQHWIKREKPTDDEIAFNNSLVIDKRPYFMRYLYNEYNKEYKNHLADFDRYCTIMYGAKYHDLSEDFKKTDEYKELKRYYDYRCPLLETDGVMNRMCHYMEKSLDGIKRKTHKVSDEDIYNILTLDNGINETVLDNIIILYNKYIDFKKSKMLASSDFSTYEQFYKSLRYEAVENISNNIEELADAAVELCYKYKGYKKDFCWDVFGNWIVKNLVSKRINSGDTFILMPLKNEIGDYKYLNDTYSFNMFDFNNIAHQENNFEDFDFNLEDDSIDELFKDFE